MKNHRQNVAKYSNYYEDTDGSQCYEAIDKIKDKASNYKQQLLRSS